MEHLQKKQILFINLLKLGLVNKLVIIYFKILNKNSFDV